MTYNSDVRYKWTYPLASHGLPTSRHCLRYQEEPPHLQLHIPLQLMQPFVDKGLNNKWPVYHYFIYSFKEY